MTATFADVDAQLRQVEPLVRRICRGRLGEVDGDDAAQRALLTVWRKVQRGDLIEDMPAYATTCARAEVLAHYRDQRRHPRPSDDLADAAWTDPGPGPDERVERADEAAKAAARVQALLDQLTPRQAEVLRSSVLAERSKADAATELGISEAGVWSAHVRAMAHLRELCGTRSTHPTASGVPYSQRRRHRLAQQARRREAVGSGTADRQARREQPARWDDGASSGAVNQCGVQFGEAYDTAAGWA